MPFPWALQKGQQTNNWHNQRYSRIRNGYSFSLLVIEMVTGFIDIYSFLVRIPH